MEAKCFKDWIKDEWGIQGGLITPVIAAKILGITRGGIASYQKKNKVKVFTDPDGKTMLSYAEIMSLAAKPRKTRRNAVSVELYPIQKKT
jgi:hypothetical protein